MTGGAVHQGLAARIPAYEYAHPDDLLDRGRGDGEQPLIVALDPVTDPRNLGAVVRSAAGFGAHGVRDPRAPRGRHDRRGLEDQRRRRGPDPGGPDGEPGPPAQGLPGGRLHGRRPGRRRRRRLPDLDLADGPLVLVVGSEGNGLSRLVAETCDQLVSIPMANQVESLNAGVAASVALYAVAAGARLRRLTRAVPAAARCRRRRVRRGAGLVLTAGCCRGRDLPAQQPDDRAGQPRRRARPDLRGYVVLRTGPVLPDVRVPIGAAGRRRRHARQDRRRQHRGS